MNAQSAQDAADRLVNPTELDTAQAEAAVASARTNSAFTQDALRRLLEPTALDMTQAEFAVANASTTLIGAEEALAVLLNPTSEQMARADTNVTNARIALDKTQETLDALVDGPSAEDIDDAQFQFDSAMTALLNNQRDLELTQNEWDDKLEAANEHFELVTIPFAEEYPKSGQWNRYGARLAFEPASAPDDTNTWDSVFRHVGADLDQVLGADPRCPSCCAHA